MGHRSMGGRCRWSSSGCFGGGADRSPSCTRHRSPRAHATGPPRAHATESPRAHATESPRAHATESPSCTPGVHITPVGADPPVTSDVPVRAAGGIALERGPGAVQRGPRRPPVLPQTASPSVRRRAEVLQRACMLAAVWRTRPICTRGVRWPRQRGAPPTAAACPPQPPRPPSHRGHLQPPRPAPATAARPSHRAAQPLRNGPSAPPSSSR
jgi:hypothetical protein